MTTGAAIGSRVAATIRPRAVRVCASRSASRTINSLSGTILDLEPRGDLIRVRSDVISADLAPAEVADARLTTGMRVEFSFEPQDVAIDPARTEGQTTSRAER